MTPRIRIGELLIEQGRIDAIQLKSALGYQQKWGGKLGQVLITLGFVTEPVLMQTLSQKSGVPYVELGDRIVPPPILKIIPEKVMRERKVMAVALLSDHSRGPLVVAMSDPWDLALVDELAFVTGKAVKPVLASDRDLDRALRRHLVFGAQPTPEKKLEPIELPEAEESDFEIVVTGEDAVFFS